MGRIKTNSIINKIVKRYIGFVFVITVLLVTYTVGIIINSYKEENNIRQLRIQLADIVASVEEGDYSKLDEYEGVIIDINSNIIYSNIDSFKVGNRVNLHILSTSNSVDEKERQYITPIVKDNIQIGTLMIRIELNENFDMSKIHLIIIPVIVLVLVLIYTIRIRKYIKLDIINPINEMNIVAKELIKGNYEAKVKYDSDNEVGQLCHSIEFFRDELHSSSIREEKLHKNEKMILACISHDLKTPVSIISGFAQGIRDGIASDKNQIVTYANTIVSKAELLTKLINDILEHSSVEDNNTSIKPIEILLPTYIEEVLSILSVDINSNNIELSVGEIPDVLLNIDPDKIYRVFQNIIGNSIKYIDNNGKIDINFQQYNKEIIVTILDNGKGINATDIPFIFNKFYRGESARTQDIAGSGLGLSIVKNIIELHGGRVECDSVIGEGTAISFSLPLA